MTEKVLSGKGTAVGQARAAWTGTASSEEEPYEEARARQLASELRGASVVIDIHNTTSNAGTMLIVGTDTDPLTLQLVAALLRADPSRRVWLNKTVGGPRSASNVGSVAMCDIGLEIGATISLNSTAPQLQIPTQDHNPMDTVAPIATSR